MGSCVKSKKQRPRKPAEKYVGSDDEKIQKGKVDGASDARQAGHEDLR